MAQTELSKEEIESEIRRLAPFLHNIELPYGLRTYLPDLSRREVERTRLQSLVKHIWPSLLANCGGSLVGKLVLDVACGCGGFSVEAAKSGAEYVLGIDVVEKYLEQANFIKRALGLKTVDFKKMAVEELNGETLGEYDVTFCLGILYHLENPVLAMKNISSVTRQLMVVDTHLDRRWFDRLPRWTMNFPDIASTDSIDASTSLWRQERVCEFFPNERAVVELLQFVGFPNVTKLKPQERTLNRRYFRGRWGTFIAKR